MRLHKLYEYFIACIIALALCGNVSILWHVYNVYKNALSYGTRIEELEISTNKLQIEILKSNSSQSSNLQKFIICNE